MFFLTKVIFTLTLLSIPSTEWIAYNRASSSSAFLWSFKVCAKMKKKDFVYSKLRQTREEIDGLHSFRRSHTGFKILIFSLSCHWEVAIKLKNRYYSILRSTLKPVRQTFTQIIVRSKQKYNSQKISNDNPQSQW